MKKAAGIIKGSGVPQKDKVGKITKAQLREIAQKKLTDLNAVDLEGAIKIIEGTARSMGVVFKGNRSGLLCSQNAHDETCHGLRRV